MKTSLRYLLVALLFVAFSCKDDDNGPSNQIKIDGTASNLGQAYIQTSTYKDATYYYLLIPTAELKATVQDGNGEFEGTGNLLIIGLYLESLSATLPANTYQEEVEDLDFYTLKDGDFDYVESPALEGNLSVQVSGDQYTIQTKAKGDKHQYEVFYRGTLKSGQFIKM